MFVRYTISIRMQKRASTMNTTQQTTWRELLGKLTERPEERQRVARVLDVSTLTVTRWVRGETEPRANNLRNLPDVFPEHRELFAELLLADYFPLASPRALAPSSPARREPEALGRAEAPVPAEYLARAVAAYASTSGPFRV